jgi:DNA-binding beta-propeller fold protein YncE
MIGGSSGLNKNIFLLTILMFLLLLPCNSVLALSDEPYQNYTYPKNGVPQLEPQAYQPNGILDGTSLGIGNFKDPKDVFVDHDGQVYIVDSGNNRIVVLTKDFAFKNEITGFANGNNMDTLSNPNSVFVDHRNYLYIADTENQRVVVLDAIGNLHRIITKPQSSLYNQNMEFLPIKIVVDPYSRVFVVSSNSLDGILQFDTTGEFMSYFGPIKVSFDISQVFKWMMTKAMRERTVLSLPTKYSGLDIDQEGFVFGTVFETTDERNYVRKLNPMGLDILRRNGMTEVYGDGMLSRTESTQFIDICSRSADMYSVLDRTKGRIFTYDANGNLLYVFGNRGQSLGSFGNPVALDDGFDDQLLILDSQYQQIVIFKPTEYGSNINDAIKLRFERNYTEEQTRWEEILKTTIKSDMAYVGVGKSLFKSGQYFEAMRYFRLGNSKVDYSRAYDEFRKSLMTQYFGKVMTITLVVALLLLLSRIIVKFVHYLKETTR